MQYRPYIAGRTGGDGKETGMTATATKGNADTVRNHKLTCDLCGARVVRVYTMERTGKQVCVQCASVSPLATPCMACNGTGTVVETAAEFDVVIVEMTDPDDPDLVIGDEVTATPLLAQHVVYCDCPAGDWQKERDAKWSV